VSHSEIHSSESGANKNTGGCGTMTEMTPSTSLFDSTQPAIDCSPIAVGRAGHPSVKNMKKCPNSKWHPKPQFSTPCHKLFNRQDYPPTDPTPYKYKTASLVTTALQTATSTKEARRASAILPNESLHSDGPLTPSPPNCFRGKLWG
jgi:hypothetical protein